MILAGFGAWAFCAAVCLMFFALVARRGQLEDQLAFELIHEALPAEEAARPALPAQALGAAIQPRTALDDQIASTETASV
jgi:hypothetical protein